VTENSWIWRHKLKAWATRNGFKSTDDIAKLYGPRWCYHLQEQILREPVLDCFPSEKAMHRSHGMEKLEFNAQYQAIIAAANEPPPLAPAVVPVYDRVYDLTAGSKLIGPGRIR
jgi:hypothetical protein